MNFKKINQFIHLEYLQYTLYLTVFYNFTFFKKFSSAYDESSSLFSIKKMSFIFKLISISSVLICGQFIFICVLSFIFDLAGFKSRKAIFHKFFLVLMFFISTLAAYFMDTFSVVIDQTMVLNVFATNSKETLELLTFKLPVYLIFGFILPTIYLLKFSKIGLDKQLSLKTFFIQRLTSIFLPFVLALILIYSSGSFYASFFREHKSIRYYANPSYWMYSSVFATTKLISGQNKQFVSYGLDARVPAEDVKRDLVILVIGETARRDHFSLNGYHRKTNPLLEKEDVISFKNATSCGTATAISVPCMFSHVGRQSFDLAEAKNMDNALDVLTHTGVVSVLWRDNNSDSKGVANRVVFENYRDSNINPICDDIECRDVGMLSGLESYIKKTTTKDILIVLHQMGNHGPAYFKRYPKEFEVFKEACESADLEECSSEKIIDAYDNGILYTDYFLFQTITFLKKYAKNFNAALFYISDHGESLGEKGIYLHSMPYMIAPKEQIEVPIILWMNDEFKKMYSWKKIMGDLERPLSHDNLFHTLLGLFEVNTQVYDHKKDILYPAKLVK